MQLRVTDEDSLSAITQCDQRTVLSVFIAFKGNDLYILFRNFMLPQQPMQLDIDNKIYKLLRFLRIFFSSVFGNLPFLSPEQPIKLSNLYKNHMKRGGSPI